MAAGPARLSQRAGVSRPNLLPLETNTQTEMGSNLPSCLEGRRACERQKLGESGRAVWGQHPWVLPPRVDFTLSSRATFKDKSERGAHSAAPAVKAKAGLATAVGQVPLVGLNSAQAQGQGPLRLPNVFLKSYTRYFLLP